MNYLLIALIAPHELCEVEYRIRVVRKYFSTNSSHLLEAACYFFIEILGLAGDVLEGVDQLDVVVGKSLSVEIHGLQCLLELGVELVKYFLHDLEKVDTELS